MSVTVQKKMNGKLFLDAKWCMEKETRANVDWQGKRFVVVAVVCANFPIHPCDNDDV